MNIKEREFPFSKFKPFKLNKEELSEFGVEAKKIDKQTEEARQVLEKQLPHLSEKISDEIKFHPSSDSR